MPSSSEEFKEWIDLVNNQLQIFDSKEEVLFLGGTRYYVPVDAYFTGKKYAPLVGKSLGGGKAYLHKSVIEHHRKKNKNHYFLINQNLKEIKFMKTLKQKSIEIAINYFNTYALLYFLVGILATLVTVWFKPLDLGIIAIPPSSWVIGFSFLLITLIAEKYGNQVASKMIWILLALTSIICFILGYSQMLVLASGVAFVAGQFATKSLYNFTKHSLISSMIGSMIDAIIWILLGLSPIGIGSVPWDMFIFAVAGQVIIQFIMQWLANLLHEIIQDK